MQHHLRTWTLWIYSDILTYSEKKKKIKKEKFSFIQHHEKGMYYALWERPGLNPGPWDTKRSSLTTALLAQS
jgi:hypothetical protein